MILRLAVVLALSLGAAPALARNNILVLMADDLGVDGVDVYSRNDLYGHPGEGANPGPTPVIDSLAAEGVLFRNAWAYPVCSSARAATLTGRYGFHTQVGFVGGILEEDQASIPDVLAAHANAAVGKWHMGGSQPEHPIDLGFDYFAGSMRSIQDYYSWPKVTNSTTTSPFTQDPYTPYATTDTVNEAITKIAEFGEDEWFLWVSFNAPHEPYQVPPAGLTTIPVNPTSDDVTKYKASIEAMDTEIGRLLASIPTGILDDTTVIFFTDNGSSGFVIEPPFLPGRSKATLYEGGINVPFIVKGPLIDPADEGSESLALISIVDIFATAAEIAGVAAPASDSVSMVPYLQDPSLPTQASRPWVYAELFRPNGAGPYIDMRRTMRDDRYKLIWRDGTYQEFFDLEIDPFEQTNLISGMNPQETTAYDALVLAMETLVPPACSNGSDDDSDGEIDFPEDPGCKDAEDLSERSAFLPCDDGVDNDGDNRADFDPVTFANPGDQVTIPGGNGDVGCKSPSWWREDPECQNGADDADPDTMRDYDAGLSVNAEPIGDPDPECLGKPWHTEIGAEACADGVDNDGDGSIDYPADPGCDDLDDPIEKSNQLPCDDGIDNDGDTRADFDPATFANPGDQGTIPGGSGDPGCKNPGWITESPDCQNGIDDADPDGGIDYDAGLSINAFPNPAGPDPECIGRPWGLETGPAACEDGIDNDGDGEIDYPDDPGCDNALDPGEHSLLLPCDDGLDNDGDTRADFDPVTFANPGDQGTIPGGTGDPGCKNPGWPTESPECQNGIDDADPDDAIDYDAGLSVNGFPNPVGPDFQCQGNPWQLETGPEACGDGLDNDDDGETDYPDDPGCDDADDSDERSPLLPCDDGLDNDGDTRVDFDPVTFANPGNTGMIPAGHGDPGCRDPSWILEDPACQNGVDDSDADHAVDHDGGLSVNGTVNPAGADPQCLGKPWNIQERVAGCGLGLELALLLPALVALRRRPRG